MATQKTQMEYDNGVLVCVQHKTPINKQNGVFFCGKCRKNRRMRDQNATLRELCGTSARAAREDMGL